MVLSQQPRHQLNRAERQAKKKRDNFRLSRAKRIKKVVIFKMNLCKFLMKAKLSEYESRLKLASLRR